MSRSFSATLRPECQLNVSKLGGGSLGRLGTQSALEGQLEKAASNVDRSEFRRESLLPCDFLCLQVLLVEGDKGSTG